MPRILLVEDQPTAAHYVAKGLAEAGLVVDVATNGPDGLHQFLTVDYDLAILDIMLPGLDGWSILETARKAGRTAPVLFLTARDDVDDRVRGLEAGADDYLVKPFEYPELAARVKALLRRSLKAASDVLVVGPLAIDFSAQSAKLEGTAVELTAFEYRLLEFLVRERARVVPKQELADYLYPHDEDRDSNVLEVLIGRLRRKLDPDGTLAPIETLRGRGYRFTLG